MTTFANAPAPRSALFDDAPTLTLPPELAAQGWRLHEGKPDLRTVDAVEHDDVARLGAEIARLADRVAALEELTHRQAGALTVLTLERELRERGL